MLTNLDFLKVGAQFPPQSELERLRTYRDNRLLFEAEHAQVFKDALTRVVRMAREAGLEVPTSYELCINYPRLVSVSTAGLLFNRSPSIIIGRENDKESMDRLEDIVDRSGLFNVLYDCAIDISRYGTGVIYIRQDEQGKAIIELSRPDVWFPVVNPANIRQTLYHVLATAYKVNKKEYVRAEIHEKGKVTIKDFELDGGRLVRRIDEQEQTTGMAGFAVVPIHNLRPSDRVYGIDDYNDLQSLVCELEVRLGQISKVLDRHTDPTMQGPEQALTEIEREDGSFDRVFIAGRYFVNQAGSNAGSISYLTWDAQLNANFELINRIIDLLRVTSEMGALLSDMTNMGNVPSGSAMRRMLYPALSKITRIRNRFEPALREIIARAFELEGVSVSDKPIYINWGDALPSDPMELAQVAEIRTAGKQTQTVKRALMNIDGLSEQEAEAELESIRNEVAEAMPIIDSPNAKDTLEDIDDE